ncbi:hypothetical protein [Paucibacter soli]|uniref:hypothetical protein n=1 Tax=Paucibacter soli TaxID=3133433 RepID=UPI00309B486C
MSTSSSPATESHPVINGILESLAQLSLPGKLMVFGSVARAGSKPSDVDAVVDLRPLTRKQYLATDPDGAQLRPLLYLAENRYGWFDPFLRFANDDLLVRSDDARKWVKAQNAAAIMANMDRDCIPLSDAIELRRPPAAAVPSTPILAYHGTVAAEDFDKFEFTEDIGFHFGPIEAANRRLADILEFGDPEDLQNARVLVCNLHLARPLRLADCYTWGSQNVLSALHGAGALTDARYEELSSDGYLDHELFREIVEAAGYDSVVYSNATEGGGDSYIALRPEQVTFVLETIPTPPASPPASVPAAAAAPSARRPRP